MSIKGKMAIITGASRGIGKATALYLAEAGADLCLLSRNIAVLDSLKAECEDFGIKACVYEFDQTKANDFDQTLRLILKDFNSIDYLINNAGFGGASASGSILEVSRENLAKPVLTNALGLMEWTRVVAPEITKSNAGAIINIASIASKATYSGGAAYSSSKHAVLGFNGCLFEDLREHGVKVCAVLPGFVDTKMVTDSSLNRDRMIRPNDVAETILFILTSSGTVCPTEITLRPQRSPYK